MSSSPTTPPPTNSPAPGGLSRENIQTIIPLLPKQHAMLLARGLDGADPGFLHVRCVVRGPLDLGLFRRAWESAVIWHAGLRMSVHPREDGDPLVIVRRQADVPLALEDWLDRSEGGIQTDLEGWLEADATRGLDLEQPSVGRLVLLQTGDETHELIWTCHHLFLDGWSAAIVLDDVARIYNASISGATPPEPPPGLAFRAIRRWLDQRDRVEDQRYWFESFRAYPGAGQFPRRQARSGSSETIEVEADLAPDLPARASAAAAEAKTTPSTLIHAAWSLALARMLQQNDLCFGTVVSGRTAPVDGIDRLVGDCSNMVPVRIQIAGEQTAAEWLRSLHESQRERQHFEHAAIADVHEWSGIPGRVPLFDTLLVVENFPANAAQPAPDGIRIGDFQSGLTSNLPITLAVILGTRWRLRAKFRPGDCHAEHAGELVRCFVEALERLIDHPQESVDALLQRIEPGAVPALVPAPEAEETDETGPITGYVPPRDDTERRLAAIWERVLGLNAIGVSDSFFILGGTSINAVRVFSQIEAEFERRLPVSTLLQHPTIEALAAILRGEAVIARPSQCLVPIQASGTKPPIACVHAGGAHVLFYRYLAARLGADQPVLGLEPVGLNGAEEPLETIPEMAARYVDELREAYPTGPYRLVGYCIGGCVCLEMASVLEAQGQQVELLAIIDSGLPWAGARVISPAARAKRKLLKRGPVALGKAIVHHARQRVKRRAELRVGSSESKARVHQELVEEACKRAFGKFEPRACEAPILLIRSSEYAQMEEKARHFRWKSYTSRLDVRVVEAEHETILMEPSVARVAVAIEETLAGS